MSAIIIVAVALTVTIFQTVKTAKSGEWGWFYTFLFVSMSGGFVIGLNVSDLARWAE